MKISLYQFLLLAMLAGIGYAHPSEAQEILQKRVSLSIRNGSLKSVLRDLEKQADLVFSYQRGVLDTDEKVKAHFQDEALGSVLAKVLNPRGVDFMVLRNKQIVLSRTKGTGNLPETLGSDPTQTFFDAPAEVIIKGTVVDDANGPLPGVSVVLKGSNRGVTTNVNGDYELAVPDQDAVLVFSFVGYATQEIPVGNRSTLDVTMKVDNKILSEVVVVGFSTQRKATVTGSMSTISTSELEQTPTATLTNALAGRMPGLFANQFAGGEPGVDRSDIMIRGMGTYGNTAPIVIVDGLERDMNYLAPSEIETFTILKDATATAPFGVRGANGVILITTKRGKVQDKAVVNFKSSAGMNQPVKFPTYLGSADYAMLYNEAIRNDNPGVNPENLNLFSQDAIDKFRRAKGDNSDGLGYDWDYFDYAFKPGFQQENTLSISGGSAKARYFVMANHFRQTGNYQHSNLSNYNTQAVFQRYNFRSNIDIDVTKDFYARLDLGARITDRSAPGTTANRIIELANTQPSYLPILLNENDDPANQRAIVGNPLGLLYGDQIYRFNILGELSRSGFLNEKNTYLNGSFILGHQLDFITRGLKIEGLFGYDSSDGIWVDRSVNTYSEGYRVYPGYATLQPTGGIDVYRNPGIYEGAYKRGNKYDIDQTLGNSTRRNENNSRTYLQAKLEYQRRFARHGVTGLLLVNRSKRNIDNQVPFTYQGVTSRLTYDFDDRYLFEVNAAYNGSENFAKGQRYGFFPAVSAGWIATGERFMSNVSWLNYLKARVSYGLVGNDRIPNDRRFVYLQYFQGGNDYQFGTDFFGSGAGGGLQEGDLANVNLTWEKAQKANFGIDATLFKNLTVTLDIFREHRYDIITDLGQSNRLGFPSIVGKNAPYVNSGIVNNQGVDFELGWSGRINDDFTYYIRPNLTYAKNEIIFMNEIPYDAPGRAQTGKSIGEHFVYVVDHFVRNADEAAALNASNNGAGYQPWGRLQPGDVVYKDINGDGVINDLGDRTAVGHPRNPQLMYGIPVGARYKGFDFSMLFQGAALTSVQLSGPAVYDFPLFSQDKYGKVKPVHLNRWTPETAETATYPALHYGDYTNNKNANSSLFLYNASYLRLKTVEMGYSLPKKLIRGIKLESVRFYAQGLNLLTWDKLNEADVDPEIREGSGDWYPVQKVVNFGVDIKF
ncbi:SusC/RagA family TonB-linked outer membrane protein [Persicitalea jodogahamensis]|uniref:SusC/RagA family TonB-linked outer membrane protein n=1 Tax=Persicitalea jodogahamensis TaxID=402147 RepID=A0A8J3G736_9BACT|nr:TonB-dependent receptor [Persicitalea jodogahamensis]GHB52641.1 SusC/RagA family TonB-linked outer membrane protein [Persicitalea jodogahamensis]